MHICIYFAVNKYLHTVASGWIFINIAAHTLCVLHNWGYRHTLRTCSSYCVSTATMVTRTRVIRYTYIACLVLVFSVYYKFVAYRLSSIGVANLLRVGRPRNRDLISRRGKKFFSFPQRQDRHGTLPSHVKKWVPACVSRGDTTAARTWSWFRLI